MTTQNKRSSEPLFKARTKKRIRISESEQDDNEEEDDSVASLNTNGPTANRTSDDNSFENNSSESSSSSEEEDLLPTASTQTTGEINHTINKLMIKVWLRTSPLVKY